MLNSKGGFPPLSLGWEGLAGEVTYLIRKVCDSNPKIRSHLYGEEREGGDGQVKLSRDDLGEALKKSEYKIVCIQTKQIH